VDDDLTIEIMRRYLVATVEEMVRTTTRTAYSTCFSEAQDFTCGMFDERGRMIAQAAGVAVHAGGLADVLQDIFKHYDEFAPGDVIIHNDPYAGGTHQADVVIARPMFYGDDVLLGWAVNRGHWVDIGGMAAGGWGGAATHVLQEALIIPPSKLYRGGELVREIRDFILRNVRIPKYAWGDLQSQIASAITAERRMAGLCDQYGLKTVREAGDRAIEYSRDRFLKGMEVIPDGVYEAEDFMENDGWSSEPKPIHVKVVKAGQRISVDFAGTSPQARGPINSSLVVTKAGVNTTLINIIDPEIPINSGCLDVVEINAPLGSMVNPVYPAPVFAGTADTVDRICETVFLALADVVRDRVTAGTYASGNCTTGWGFLSEEVEYVWYSFGGGGCGARASKDGNSADWHAMATCKNESAEIWENRYPVRVVDYRLRTDSGGAGRWRGGLGHVKALEMLNDTNLSACTDRNIIPPFGLEGGAPGECNRLTLEIAGEELDFSSRYGTTSSSKFSNLSGPKGSVYRIYSGGGGGFGPAETRPAELVCADVRAGYVSLAGAERDYKVAISPDTLEVDEVRSAALRGAQS
jgi:N-methylhydantoinase B/oxoprolinase/acetone carboxylase alpha subunit